VLDGLTNKDVLKSYRQSAYVPFDPVHKRTEATIDDGQGETFQVTKGAPQVIIEMSVLTDDETKHAQQVVDAFAKEGYRALGVARKEQGAQQWTFLGILSLFDPPREDSAETIASAEAHGVHVKMITGDNQAIARQISGKLGLGMNILPASALSLDKDGRRDAADGERVEKTDGFAEVFPEHKFAIVKLLQARNHITGMTGDGVNDAPALKQADVGIAVSGATDAARAAADLVLTAPGLSVIINAIEEARRIFERMNAYAVYRISETIRIMIFVVLTMIFFNFYPITAIMIILLAFFNDVPIMTIAYDHTGLEKSPVRWNMNQVITVATAMGIVGVIGSFGMLLIAMDWLKLDVTKIQTYVFLKMAVAGHLVLFAARAKEHMWKRPWPAPIMTWSAVITKLAATILAAYGFGLITPITWPEIALIWGYSILSALVTDFVKVQVYHHLKQSIPRHQGFLATVQQPLHSFGRKKQKML
jgi:H+-transporting ATPase